MISYRSATTLADFHQVFTFLQDLEDYYPDFSTWYWSRSVPDVLHGPGSMVLAEQSGDVVGVAMGRSGQDPKLRCVRVHPRLSGRGLSMQLIDRSLRQIGSDRPEFTVPEELIHGYSRIMVNRYGFDLRHVERGLYLPGKLEYQFNGMTNHRVHQPF